MEPLIQDLKSQIESIQSFCNHRLTDTLGDNDDSNCTCRYLYIIDIFTERFEINNNCNIQVLLCNIWCNTDVNSKRQKCDVVQYFKWQKNYSFTCLVWCKCSNALHMDWVTTFIWIILLKLVCYCKSVISYHAFDTSF